MLPILTFLLYFQNPSKRSGIALNYQIYLQVLKNLHFINEKYSTVHGETYGNKYYRKEWPFM